MKPLELLIIQLMPTKPEI